MPECSTTLNIAKGPILWGLLLCVIASILMPVSWVGILSFGAFIHTSARIYHARKSDMFSLIDTHILIVALLTILFTATYYIAGLSRITYIVALLIFSLYIYFNGNEFVFPRVSWKKTNQRLSTYFFDRSRVIATIILFVLLWSLFQNPVYSGSPSPWQHLTPIHFLLFTILCGIFALRIHKKQNPALYFIGLFITVGVVACMYPLTYGYDMLIHQAGLLHIAKFGSLGNFLPYYMGEYSLEIFIHFITNWEISTINRFFVPVAYCVTILTLVIKQGSSFLNTWGFSAFIATLFIIPSVFIVSTPYGYALLWALISVYFFVHNQKMTPTTKYVALFSAISSVAVHPFVGIIPLFIILGCSKAQNVSRRYLQLILYVGTWLAIACSIPFSFMFFTWITGKQITLTDPLFYSHQFTSLFGSPVWYQPNTPVASFAAKLFYSFEQFHLLVLLGVVLILLIKKSTRSLAFKTLFICSAVLCSAWIFVAGFVVSGFSALDNINYAYRLTQVAAWFAFPSLLVAFHYIDIKRNILRIPFTILFSIILSIFWYITYPRYDAISQPHINTTRKVDYEAVTFIHEHEGGKEDYIVFANQLFGAIAVKKYGFGPYYMYNNEQVLYYSAPYANPLHRTYERLLDSAPVSFSMIDDALRQTGVQRAYVITTNYWNIADNNEHVFLTTANTHWTFDNGAVHVYVFTRK